jgi:hypothetical protein
VFESSGHNPSFISSISTARPKYKKSHTRSIIGDLTSDVS